MTQSALLKKAADRSGRAVETVRRCSWWAAGAARTRKSCLIFVKELQNTYLIENFEEILRDINCKNKK